MDGTVLYFIVFTNKEKMHRNQTIDRIRLGGIGTPHKIENHITFIVFVLRKTIIY